MPERYAGALERVVSELLSLAKLNGVDFGHERIGGHYSPTLQPPINRFCRLF
jgi:hypothetical protein